MAVLLQAPHVPLCSARTSAGFSGASVLVLGVVVGTSQAEPVAPAAPRRWLPTEDGAGWDGQHRRGLSVGRASLFWGEKAQHPPHLGLQSQVCQLTRPGDLPRHRGPSVPVSVTQELRFPPFPGLSGVQAEELWDLDGRGGCCALGPLQACQGWPWRCAVPTRRFGRSQQWSLAVQELVSRTWSWSPEP